MFEIYHITPEEGPSYYIINKDGVPWSYWSYDSVWAAISEIARVDETEAKRLEALQWSVG